MVTQTTQAANHDGPEAAVRALAVHRARLRSLAVRVDRVQDAPSQILAGFGAWRRMTVCPRTGAERGGC